MTKRMLIDATHSEETRVVVADNNQLLDYEYESAMRKQLRGNIFLAKVTRVEPSLQAAFVNYGGNRHGFLPFSEIHPDYYRIPIADREALIEEQKQAMEEARKREEEEDAELEAMAAGEDKTEENYNKKSSKKSKAARAAKEEIIDDEDQEEEDELLELGAGTIPELGDDEEEEDEEEDDDDEDEASAEDTETSDESDENNGRKPHHQGRKGGRRFSRGKGRRRGRGAPYKNDQVEMLGGDSIEGDRPIRPNLTRRYKIQEVIKRGQIMLVQVSKEERGQKGAAVTTYLSLPGRYCVLMPNSPRSGGVSRKIANYKDRKRLRDILKEFKVPEGMSVIVRTAGVARTKTEIKRDLDYLIRLWDNIRTTTLESQAPALIYEEGALVKRAIRDIYDRDMEEIIIEGEEGYKQARDIMKMMIPSHAKRVKEYKDHKRSLFHAHKLEEQISGIGEPSVPLKSGGSLVIHPTEALVSIDVNSGRATKERHIEETPLRTNLEAAEEVARQLRLRDLGGLVVIDFIDMEDRRNNRKVENKLKEALSTDRARLQVGRISSFGLMELSRQRISASVTDTQFQRCAHCEGTGYTRTIDSMAILVLRALETLAIEGNAAEVAVSVSNDVALYILNQKRLKLSDIETRYEMKIFISADAKAAPSFHEIEVIKTRKELLKEQKLLEDAAAAIEDEDEEQNNEERSEDNSHKGKNGRGRRGRGGKGRGRGNERQQPAENKGDQTDNQSQKTAESREGNDKDDDQTNAKRSAAADKKSDASQDTQKSAGKDTDKDEKPKRGRGRKAKPKQEDAPETNASEVNDSAADEAQAESEEQTKPKRRASSTRKKKTEEEKIEQSAPSNDDIAPPGTAAVIDVEASQEHARAAEVINEAPKKKKKGWWNKLVE